MQVYIGIYGTDLTLWDYGSYLNCLCRAVVFVSEAAAWIWGGTEQEQTRTHKQNPQLAEINQNLGQF